MKGGTSQIVFLTVTPEGQPTEISFPRWSNVNSEKIFKLQPLGGYLSEYRELSGFRLPAHEGVGNFFGTEDFFLFFVVDIAALNFPRPE